MQKRRPPDDQQIFGGDYSVKMWEAVNAIEAEDVKDALYFVCCRLQELESRLERGAYSGDSNESR